MGSCVVPYLDLPDLRLYYETHGDAAAEPLVLLHGFNGSGGAAWRHHIPVFGERYRLIVPDWRGHGRTDNPLGAAGMNHRQFARDCAAMCGALGIERAVFVGQSSGAMQLLYFALEQPALVKALIFCAGSHCYPDELRAWWRTLTPEAWVSPERREALRQVHTALGPEHWCTVVGAWIALGEHAHEDDFPPLEALHGIAAPTLIVHGDRDRFFPVDVPTDLYRRLPNAELAVLPNTGHGVPSERPEWLTRLALDFLTRHGAA